MDRRGLALPDFEVLRFAFPVALVVFRVLLRVAVAELRRFGLALPRLAAPFFVVERFLRLRGFSVGPVTAPAMALAALDIPSMAASMPVLAGSAIVPRTPSSFSLSMLFTSLRVTLSVTLSLGRGQLRTLT